MASFEHGETFIVTVRPKDLPECWGIRLSEIHLPGCDIHLEAITEEISENGIPHRRGFFKTKDGKKKRLWCVLVSPRQLSLKQSSTNFHKTDLVPYL